MSLHVLTAKLQDGTTQTIQVPSTLAPNDFVRHIRDRGGFWSDFVPPGGTGSLNQGGENLGGTTVGAVFVPYDTIDSITYTS